MRRHAPIRRAAAPVILAALLGSGCIHNHYYGQTAAVPVCEGTPAQQVASAYGSVCEVPGQVAGGSVSVNTGTTSTVVSSAGRPPRVLVSEATGGARRGGFWRRPDPESLATTKVQGALDDETRIY